MKKCIKCPLVYASNHQSNYQIRIRLIQKLAAFILNQLKKKNELRIAFVSDSQIRKINKLFHGTDDATDVLAFESPSFGKRKSNIPDVLGEIIISVDHANSNSMRFNVTRDEELMRYVIHGILHLLGERDDQKAPKEKMFRKQERLLKLLMPLPKLMVG